MIRLEYKNLDITIKLDDNNKNLIIKKEDNEIVMNAKQVIGCIVIFREMLEKMKGK